MIWFYRLLYLPGFWSHYPITFFGCGVGGYAKSFQHRFGQFHRLEPVAAGKKRIWLQAVVWVRRSRLAHSSMPYKKIQISRSCWRRRPALATQKRENVTWGWSRASASSSRFLAFSRTTWNRIQPNAVLLTESELWPEHLHQARKRKIPAHLVNARISDTSFKRYQQVPTWLGAHLKSFAVSTRRVNSTTLACSNLAARRSVFTRLAASSST